MSVRVGVQLYSVREALKQDPFGTLERVAELGFQAVEAANHSADKDDGVGFGVDARSLKHSFDQLGITIVGCHVSPLRLDLLPNVLDYHLEIGNTQIGCDIELYPYNDLDYVLRRAEFFNQVGALCRERGMRFYYHNHYQEFQKIDGRTVYEIIMENTDPELVYVQMDTYWMARGGQDPVAMIRQYADRLVLIHQKDFPRNANQPLVMYDGIVDPKSEITLQTFLDTKDPACFTEIGSGVLPIQEIIDAAGKCPNLEYLLVEQDHSQTDELTSLATSRAALERYTGISLDQA